MKKMVSIVGVAALSVLFSGCMVPPTPPTQGYGGSSGYSSYTVGYGYGDGDSFGGYGTYGGYGGWASSYYSPVNYDNTPVIVQ